MAAAIADFLRAAGLPDEAAGEAPEKTAEAWKEHLLAGYQREPLDLLEPTWPDRGGEMVTMRRIPFVSVCAHHLLPFFGEVHLGYVPAGRLTGLSRLEDLVDCLSRRLQVQERLTEEIVDALMEGIGASGAACLVEAEHLCVFARGKRPRGSRTQTLSFRGDFRTDGALQDRFLRMVLAGVNA